MEYVDGHLVERNIGEHHHSRIVSIIAAELGNREAERGFDGFMAVRIAIQLAAKRR